MPLCPCPIPHHLDDKIRLRLTLGIRCRQLLANGDRHFVDEDEISIRRRHLPLNDPAPHERSAVPSLALALPESRDRLAVHRPLTDGDKQLFGTLWNNVRVCPDGTD